MHLGPQATNNVDVGHFSVYGRLCQQQQQQQYLSLGSISARGTLNSYTKPSQLFLSDKWKQEVKESNPFFMHLNCFFFFFTFSPRARHSVVAADSFHSQPTRTSVAQLIQN